MVNEGGVLVFSEWIAANPKMWVLVVGLLLLAGLAVGWLLEALQRGPMAAFAGVGRVFSAGLGDVFGVSPRRVWALSWLAIQESIRRRVVVAFAVFIIVLLFAGWFLDPGSTEPGRLYLSFVLTATTYLVLLLALFLSSMSLPNDIRHKTLHTVVTKPVRPSEIVLGRMVGFTVVGTSLLALMGLLSYLFVVMGLNHTHSLSKSDVDRAVQACAEGRQGSVELLTDESQGHRHLVRVEPTSDGEVRVAQMDTERSHWHDLSYSFQRKGGSSSDVRMDYSIGPAQGSLVARVPVYGKLRFLSPQAVDTDKGVNVGDEWAYRSYIQGGTQAAGVWTFGGLRPENFADEVSVEMNIGVFRTHKGNIERGILGSLALRNPKTGLFVEVEVFESKEFAVKRINIPRKITSFSSKQMVQRKWMSAKGEAMVYPPTPNLDNSLLEKKEFDLFQDLVADGQTEIWLRCLESAQYFGVAQADLYVRQSDASFAVNFVKGYLGIWLQMVLVICFGVMFSTFLSGPVAMIGTLGVLLGGIFLDFVTKLGHGDVYGGGPLESVIRLVNQQNVISELDPGLGASTAKMADKVLEGFLLGVSHLLPPFGQFSFSEHVACGYDVSFDLLLVRVITAVAFAIPLFVIGLFFLKTREIAQ
jgi:hypothetical protein